MTIAVSSCQLCAMFKCYCYIKYAGERDECIEDIEIVTSGFDEAVEQISPDLVTFSQLPQSRWKNLLNLDTIRVGTGPDDLVVF